MFCASQSVKTKETNPTRPGSPFPCKQALKDTINSVNSSVFETTSLYWSKEHSLYVNDSDLLVVWMGCLWFVRIFLDAQCRHDFFFVRAGHALNFFSLLGRLQNIVFQIFQTSPPRPSKAKWFAPNCAWRFSFKKEIRTRH